MLRVEIYRFEKIVEAQCWPRNLTIRVRIQVASLLLIIIERTSWDRPQFHNFLHNFPNFNFDFDFDFNL